MHIQTIGLPQQVAGIGRQAIRTGLQMFRAVGSNSIAVPFDLSKPEVLCAEDLPDHLRRDLQLAGKQIAPSTTWQMLELRFY